jgi:hypothetical protein
MTEAILFDPIERLFGIMNLVLGYMASYFYYFRGRQNERKAERRLLYGFSMLVIGLTNSRACAFIAMYFIQGHYDGHTFVGDLDVFLPAYGIIATSGYIFQAIGFAQYFFMYESSIRRTKHFISILECTSLGFVFITAFFMSFEINTSLNTINMIINITFFLVTIVEITRLSEYELKAITILLVVAMVLAVISMGLDLDDIKKVGLIPRSIPQALVMISWLFGMAPLLVNPRRFKKTFRLWLVLGVVSLGFLSTLFAFFIFLYSTSLLPLWLVIASLAACVILFLIVYSVMRMLKREMEKAILRTSAVPLAVFSKPQKLTDEEISVSKEKQTCLVCKVELSRLNYICPACKALYCTRCSEAVSNLENACWSCNTPIDPGKPIKTVEPEAEEQIGELKGETAIKSPRKESKKK